MAAPKELPEAGAGETTPTNAVPWTEVLAALRVGTNSTAASAGVELGAVTNRIASGSIGAAASGFSAGGETGKGAITPRMFLELFQQRSPLATNSQTTVLLPVEFTPPQPFEPPSSKATFTTPKEN
jgi:hypothetical protein